MNFYDTIKLVYCPILNHALMRKRAGLDERLESRGQRGENLLEPLRRFVLSLREAEKLAREEKQDEYRKFFRDIGSNPTLKDKTLSINWNELWDFTAQTKADFALRSAASGVREPRGADEVAVSSPQG